MNNEYNGTWAIDPTHSSVGFSVRHAMVATVRGTFDEVGGEVVIDGDQGSVNAEISIASIHTGQEKRDAHLRSADFFDAEQHPVATYRSTGVEKLADDRFVVNGELALRGRVRPVALECTFAGIHVDHTGKTRAGLTATGVISRKEFGMVWNAALEAGGVLVSDEVTLSLAMAAVKA